MQMLFELNYTKIGYFSGAKGLDGRLLLKHVFSQKHPFKGIKHLFLELNTESYIPFFITKVDDIAAGETIIYLEDITNPEEAKKLNGLAVYLSDNQIKASPIDNNPIFFNGFEVTNQANYHLGKIITIEEIAGQVLATISLNENEYILPINDETLLNVDATKKVIQVAVPEGLLEIYNIILP